MLYFIIVVKVVYNKGQSVAPSAFVTIRNLVNSSVWATDSPKVSNLDVGAELNQVSCNQRPLRDANQVDFFAGKIWVFAHRFTGCICVVVHVVENGIELRLHWIVKGSIDLDALGVSSSHLGYVVSEPLAVCSVLAMIIHAMEDNSGSFELCSLEEFLCKAK